MTVKDVTTYCDGAKMAYQDCAKMVGQLIENAPPELGVLLQALWPLAQAMEAKGNAVYGEAYNFLNATRQ